ETCPEVLAVPAAVAPVLASLSLAPGTGSGVQPARRRNARARGFTRRSAYAEAPRPPGLERLRARRAAAARAPRRDDEAHAFWAPEPGRGPPGPGRAKKSAAAGEGLEMGVVFEEESCRRGAASGS